MKKRKSVALKFALIFSIGLTIFSIFVSVLISLFLWLSTMEQKESELENAVLIIEKAIEKQDNAQLTNGFSTLPYYIDYIVYSINRNSTSKDFELVTTNNPYLPYLEDTFGKAKSYFEENYYIDGNLNILYFAKRIKYSENQIIIQASVNMDSDSSTKFFKSLPKIIFICMIPLLSLCFLISYYYTKGTMRPLLRIIEKAKQIGSSSLSERLPTTKVGNEFDELASTFNDLFSRLQNDFERERQFTSDVSHELKTPITVISGQTNLLRRWGKDDPIQLEKSLEIIINESKSMENIISILLEMSRLESGKIQPKYTTIQIKEFFERLETETKTINNMAKFNFNRNINNIFTTDEELLHQVFMVVISNSLKFCSQDLQITLTHQIKGKKNIFEISDNGEGFPPKIIPHVFERFYRGDDAHSRSKGGSGLGLSIAKTIITSMNGRIQAENVKNGTGALIRIIL